MTIQSRTRTSVRWTNGWVALAALTFGVAVAGDAAAQRNGAFSPSALTQATAATQPYPQGDAIVPQQVDIAPLDQVTDPALVMTTVTDGRGSMPPLGGVLSAEQVRAVADYVVTELFN